MKYAFYPGCVAQGAAPELYTSTIEVCRMLGIELDAAPMQSASCTGVSATRSTPATSRSLNAQGCRCSRFAAPARE